MTTEGGDCSTCGRSDFNLACSNPWHKTTPPTKSDEELADRLNRRDLPDTGVPLRVSENECVAVWNGEKWMPGHLYGR